MGCMVQWVMAYGGIVWGVGILLIYPRCGSKIPLDTEYFEKIHSGTGSGSENYR